MPRGQDAPAARGGALRGGCRAPSRAGARVRARSAAVIEEAFDGDDAKADARRVKVECLVDASACAMRRGDAEKAQRAASRALHFDPGSVPALVRRATARAWGGGEMDAAVADLEEALKLAPNDADAAADYARVRAMRANGVRDGHANENGVHNGHANGVTRNGISNGGRGGGGRGLPRRLRGEPALPPPVPLFNAARAPNETHFRRCLPERRRRRRARPAEEAEGARGASRRGRAPRAAAGTRRRGARTRHQSARLGGVRGRVRKPRRKRRRASRRTRRWCRTRQIRRRRRAPRAGIRRVQLRSRHRTSARAVGPRRGVFRLQPRPRS